MEPAPKPLRFTVKEGQEAVEQHAADLVEALNAAIQRNYEGAVIDFARVLERLFELDTAQVKELSQEEVKDIQLFVSYAVRYLVKGFAESPYKRQRFNGHGVTKEGLAEAMPAENLSLLCHDLIHMATAYLRSAGGTLSPRFTEAQSYEEEEYDEEMNREEMVVLVRDPGFQEGLLGNIFRAKDPIAYFRNWMRPQHQSHSGEELHARHNEFSRSMFEEAVAGQEDGPELRARLFTLIYMYAFKSHDNPAFYTLCTSLTKRIDPVLIQYAKAQRDNHLNPDPKFYINGFRASIMPLLKELREGKEPVFSAAGYAGNEPLPIDP